MKSKVIGWNINQRSGMGKGIPQFVIDELIGQQEIVIKSLGKYIKQCKFISGATYAFLYGRVCCNFLSS